MMGTALWTKVSDEVATHIAMKDFADLFPLRITGPSIAGSLFVDNNLVFSVVFVGNVAVKLLATNQSFTEFSGAFINTDEFSGLTKVEFLKKQLGQKQSILGGEVKYSVIPAAAFVSPCSSVSAAATHARYKKVVAAVESEVAASGVQQFYIKDLEKRAAAIHEAVIRQGSTQSSPESSQSEYEGSPEADLMDALANPSAVKNATSAVATSLAQKAPSRIAPHRRKLTDSELAAVKKSLLT